MVNREDELMEVRETKVSRSFEAGDTEAAGKDRQEEAEQEVI